MVPAVVWFIVIFGPPAAVALLAIRAARNRSDAAWADYHEVGEIFGWFYAPLALVAIPQLAFHCAVSLYNATLTAAAAIVAFQFAVHASTPYDRGTIGMLITRVFAGSGRELGILAFIAYTRLSGTTDSIVPSAYLYFILLWIDYLGPAAVRSVSQQAYGWASLAPSELLDRIHSLAKQRGVKLGRVLVLRGAPGQHRLVYAAAAEERTLLLSADLVSTLTKDEVDAVLEHEIGHLADERIWSLNQAVHYGSSLALLALVVVAQGFFQELPAQYWGIMYVSWALLFILPQIPGNWYSRRIERKANANVGLLSDPVAAISGDLRLARTVHLPTCRRALFWLVSSHPCTDEIVAEIAKRAGLTPGQVEEARLRSLSDGPHYDLAVAPLGQAMPKTGSPAETAPIDRSSRTPGCSVHFLSALGALAFVTIFAMVIISAENALPDWARVTLWSVCFLGAAVILVVPPFVARNRRRQQRQQIPARLSEKYGEEVFARSSLIDVRFPSDVEENPPWQGALLEVADGHIHLRGEVNEQRIPLTGISITRKRDTYSSLGRESKVVAITFEDDDSNKTLLLRPLFYVKTGIPERWKDLENWLKGLVEGSGGETVPLKELLRGRRRKRLKWSYRVPVSMLLVAVIAAVAFLAGAILNGGSPTAGLVWGLIAAFIAGAKLWDWVTEAYKPEE